MKRKQNRNTVPEERSKGSQLTILKYLRGKSSVSCDFGENIGREAEQVLLKERKILLLHRANQKLKLV